MDLSRSYRSVDIGGNTSASPRHECQELAMAVPDTPWHCNSQNKKRSILRSFTFVFSASYIWANFWYRTFGAGTSTSDSGGTWQASKLKRSWKQYRTNCLRNDWLVSTVRRCRMSWSTVPVPWNVGDVWSFVVFQNWFLCFGIDFLTKYKLNF